MRPLVPLALSATMLAACITESIRIEAPANSPPSIESTSTAAHPLNEVIRLTRTTSADGGTASELVPPVLHVLVRDVDVDQELTYAVFIDDRVGAADLFMQIPSTGEATRVVPPIVLPLETLMVDGCHRVELFVSHAFNCRMGGVCRPEPEEPGDLGTAVWWVATRTDPDDTSPIDMTGCPE